MFQLYCYYLQGFRLARIFGNDSILAKQHFECTLALGTLKDLLQGFLLTLLLVWFYCHYCSTLVSTLCVQTCCTRGESVLEDINIDYEQGAYIHRHTWNKYHTSPSIQTLAREYNFITAQLYMVGVLPGATMHVNTHLVSCSTCNNVHRSPREFEAICHL